MSDGNETNKNLALNYVDYSDLSALMAEDQEKAREDKKAWLEYVLDMLSRPPRGWIALLLDDNMDIYPFAKGFVFLLLCASLVTASVLIVGAVSVIMSWFMA